MILLVNIALHCRNGFSEPVELMIFHWYLVSHQKKISWNEITFRDDKK